MSENTPEYGAPVQAPVEAAPVQPVQYAAPTPARPVPMFEGEADLEADEDAEGTAGSLLDLFEAELEQDEPELVRYVVVGKPQYAVEFDLDVSSDDLKRYTKQAKGRKKNDADADPKIVSGMTLAERHLGIYRNGKRLLGADGQPLVFASEEFLRLTKKTDVVSAIIKFLGEGNTFSMSNAIIEAAGFGGEAVEADPTTR